MQGPVEHPSAEPRPRVRGEITVRNWAIVTLFALGGGVFLVGALVAVVQWSLWYVPVVLVYLLLSLKIGTNFLRETGSARLPDFQASRDRISESLVIAWMVVCSAAFGVLVGVQVSPTLAAVPLLAAAASHCVAAYLGAGVTDDLDRTPPRWGILTAVLKAWSHGSPKLRDAAEPIGCAIQITIAVLCLGFWIAAWVLVEVAATGLLHIAAVIFYPYTHLMRAGSSELRGARFRRMLLGLPLALLPVVLVGLLVGRIWAAALS